MEHLRNHIVFTVLYSGQEHRLQTYGGEYRDLRALIADMLFLEDFGQCGGMGRCGTCLIEVNELKNKPAERVRNESVTLSKMGMTQTGIRLACQIQINDDLENMVVRVLENT